MKSSRWWMLSLAICRRRWLLLLQLLSSKLLINWRNNNSSSCWLTYWQTWSGQVARSIMRGGSSSSTDYA